MLSPPKNIKNKKSKGGKNQNQENIPQWRCFLPHFEFCNPAVKIKSISVMVVENISITLEKD